MRTSSATPLVLLVGNPNCGKSTLFNAITGGDRAVGNWAGVTVDSGMGSFTHAGQTIDLIDLPGVYSLSPSTLDERVTRDAVAAGDAHVIVNVLDSSNLERNLYLTMQLIELSVAMVVVLNMGDTAQEAGLAISASALSEQLGCPVVETRAARGTGVEAVRAAIVAASQNPAVPTLKIELDPVITTEIDELARALDPSLCEHVPARWIATRLLEFDNSTEQLVSAELLVLRDAAATQVEDALDEEADILIADARYARISQLASVCISRRGELGASRTERIDRVILHRRWGIPVFVGVMYMMFLLTINIGSAFIDFFDQLGALLFVDIPSALLYAIGMPDGVVVLLANGIGGGLQSVATFIPPVGIMFLCLRTLEDSGYMARAAFVMDRFMRRIGLPGKAFVPMIVGFGCNVPAIMGARTLERERDRKLAVAINPFMSCGARLPIYALFAASFFPSSGQMVVLALYLIGIAFAVMTGLILKSTVLQGELTPFIMELPPYHRPQLMRVLKGAWLKLRGFLVGAGRIIVPVVAALTILGSMGTNGTFGHENANDSVLSAVGRTITPAFSPMGIEQDNWQATVGLFTGIFAKETVVGTLDALYAQSDGSRTPARDAGLDPVRSIGDALATIPPGLATAARSMIDPLGLSVGPIADREKAATEQGVSASTFNAMTARFDGQAGAFAYLLFALLYVPCVAATAAIYRETGRSWAIFVGSWTTGLAFMTATIWYQIMTFADHPGSSSAWIIALIGIFCFVVSRMRAWNKRDEDHVLSAGSANSSVAAPLTITAAPANTAPANAAPANAHPVKAAPVNAEPVNVQSQVPLQVPTRATTPREFSFPAAPTFTWPERTAPTKTLAASAQTAPPANSSRPSPTKPTTRPVPIRPTPRAVFSASSRLDSRSSLSLSRSALTSIKKAENGNL